jgi:type III secretion protein D
MECFYKLKWLNGSLAGRELLLPDGEICIGGGDPDIALPLEQDACAVLTITADGVTIEPDAPAWVDGHRLKESRYLPLNVAVDLAGQAFVLGHPDAALPMLPIPPRQVAAGGRAAVSGGARWLACASAISVTVAAGVLLWRPAPAAPPFDRLAWVSGQLKDPLFAGLDMLIDDDKAPVLKGTCVTSSSVHALRIRLREKGIYFRDESVCADTLRESVLGLLSLNGYRDVEVQIGATLDTVSIDGAIVADQAWQRTAEQLRSIPALRGWKVTNDRAELFGQLVSMMTSRDLLDGVSVEISGTAVLVSGHLTRPRAQALSNAIDEFNQTGGYRMTVEIQDIAVAPEERELLPAAVVSVAGNADSIYVDLANGMRLQRGSTLPGGYRIHAVNRSSISLLRGQRLISLPLAF